jgi:hypothetical protein
MVAINIKDIPCRMVYFSQENYLNPFKMDDNYFLYRVKAIPKHLINPQRL